MSKSIADEVKFLIECYEKANDATVFKKRLHELFLTGDVSKNAYECIKIIYFNDEPVKAKTKNKTSTPPATISSGCSGGAVGRRSLGC